MAKCVKCNHVYDDALSVCPVCGEPRDASGSSEGPGAVHKEDVHREHAGAGSDGPEDVPHAGSSGHPSAGAQSTPPSVEAAERKGGAAPMVLGILAILIPYVGLVLGILAIVFGNNARRTNPKNTSDYGMATAGWIMGIVGVCIQGIVLVIALFTAIAIRTAIGAGLSCLGTGLSLIPWY